MLYWLSKYGFECAFVDHVGLDIIANPQTSELMGISVKSRSRSAGTESTSLNISHDNLDKLDTACAAFSCQPYYAIVIDAAVSILAFSSPQRLPVTLLKLCAAADRWASWPHRARMYVCAGRCGMGTVRGR